MADIIYERPGGDSLAPLWILIATVAVVIAGWLLYRGTTAAPNETTPNTVNNYEAPDLNIGGGTPAPAPAPAEPAPTPAQ